MSRRPRHRQPDRANEIDGSAPELDVGAKRHVLQALYGKVDRRVARLVERHSRRLRCARGCASCCVDGITVFEIEAQSIRDRNGELLAATTPHPPGACAFLDEQGSCRIYPDRPYVCRTQGLPLRWLVESDSGEIVENRDICPINELDREPIESLDPSECWSIGEYEGRLAGLQRGPGSAAGRRVALRDLFGLTDEEQPG